MLVTGFEAFGGHPENPTAQLVAALGPGAVQGLELHTAVLPVAYRRAVAALLALVDALDPDAVLCCGLSVERSGIAVERTGGNLMDTPPGDLADGDGLRPRGEPVVPGAPERLPVTLPVAEIVVALRAAGIPAEASGSAGTYVCNAVLYALLERLRRGRRPVAAGFFHFPATPALAGRPPDREPMELATMLRAVEVVLATLAPRLGGGQPTPNLSG